MNPLHTKENIVASLDHMKSLPAGQRNKKVEKIFNEMLALPNPSPQDWEDMASRLYFLTQLTLQSPITGGTIEFAENPVESEMIIPAFGKAKYSREVRHEKLNEIAYITVNQKKISPGCSVVINLISDEILEAISLVRSEQLRNKNPGLKELVNNSIFNIEHLVTYVTSITLLTSRFHSECNEKFDKIDHQKNFIKNRKMTLDDNNALVATGNLLPTSPGIKRLFNALNLLEDFVTQEMHLLFRPLSDSPNLDLHVERLMRRVYWFEHLLEKDLYALIPDRKKYLLEIKEQHIFLKKFCKTFYSGLKKLQEKQEFDQLGKLWHTFESLKYNSTPKITNDYTKNPNDPSLSTLKSISNRLNWFFFTLQDEACIILISDLLDHGEVQNFEIYECIEKLIDTRRLIDTYDTSSIENQLEMLPEDNKYTASLNFLWNRYYKNQQKNNLFKTIQNRLEWSLKKCKENSNDKVEHALLLKTALYSLGRHTAYFTSLVNKEIIDIKNVSEKKRIIDAHEDFEHPEIIKTFDAIIDLNAMESNLNEIAILSIKSLISRGLMKMEEALEMRREELSTKARNTGDLLVSESNKKLNEKSVKSKKKNQKQMPVKQNLPSKDVSPKNQTIKKNEIKVLEIKKNELKVIPEHRADQVVKKVEEYTTWLDSFEISDFSSSLRLCKKLIADLQKFQIEKSIFQAAQIENLNFLMDYLLEINDEPSFSVDHIFEQLDLLRRSVEAALEIATVYTSLNLGSIRQFGHHSERLFYALLNDRTVPENIRKLLWNLREVPLALSEANRSVNYPEEGFALKNRFDASAMGLSNYLSEVIETDKEEEKSKLLLIQEKRMRQGIYFVSRLLSSIVNPEIVIDGTLPNEFPLFTQERLLSDTSPLDNCENKLIRNEDVIEILQIDLSIKNRKDALLGIDKALIWISIRCMSPVVGVNLFTARREARDLALKNCTIYLSRLKEKLGVNRTNRPMSTILGQCGLVRRLQKELLIAALYHGDHFKDGKPVVEACDARFENSPIVLMKLLKTVSSSKELPFLNGWLHQVHQVLSYPVALDKERSFSSQQIQELVEQAHKYSIEMKLDNEWIEVVDGEKMTAQKRLQQRTKLVEDNEQLRIYPEIASALKILKNGLTIPENKYL